MNQGPRELEASVYLETTVVGHIAGRLHTDTVVLGRQTITRRWWNTAVKRYRLFASNLVAAECGAGDAEAGQERLALLTNFDLLDIDEETEKLANALLVNQAVCALKFFYTVTCKRDWIVTHVPFGQRPKTLPVVLSGDEVARIVACTTNIKHRTVVLTHYSDGLRISEGLRLKVKDIDSERMTLKINQGKSQNDRYVPISPRLLAELRKYWKENRPSDYFFPGRTDDTPLNNADGARQKIIDWVKEWLLDRIIAERLRVSPSNVRYWRDRNGVTRKNRPKGYERLEELNADWIRLRKALTKSYHSR